MIDINNRFFLMSLLTTRGWVTLVKVGFVLPHAGSGMSTITIWSE
jgi:hypothetical protein